MLAAEGRRDEAERLGRELLAAYEASGSTDQGAALKKKLDTHFAASAAATK